MQTFISRSIPFKKVIQDLAKEFNTTYIQDCQEYTLHIPPHLGEGSIKGVNYDEGVGLMRYDCLFKEDTEIHFIVNQVHPLKFMFCEKGTLSHRFQDEIEEHVIDELENIIIASSGFRGHVLKFKANERLKIDNLEIDRARFYQFRSCEIRKLRGSLRNLFEDMKATKIFYYQGSYSLQTSDVFDRINNFRGDSFLRDLFIHSQLYLIFYIQVLEYKESLMPDTKRSLLLKREINLINEASKAINSNLNQFKSVRNLSRQVGTNINKLQNGFKEMYGMTVNQYVNERRLIECIILIRNTDLTISEIADRIGIRSKSYLSKIFKKKYGITPSEVRKKLKASIKV